MAKTFCERFLPMLGLLTYSTKQPPPHPLERPPAQYHRFRTVDVVEGRDSAGNVTWAVVVPDGYDAVRVVDDDYVVLVPEPRSEK